MGTVSAMRVHAVPCLWKDHELLTRLSGSNHIVLAKQNLLTFVYRGEATNVFVGGGIQLPLERLPTTDLWVLSIAIHNLDQAVISYSLILQQDDHIQSSGLLNIWRGVHAPGPVPYATALHGHLSQHQCFSQSLNEMRDLTVYQPPAFDPSIQHNVLYLADGEAVADLAHVVEPSIRDGTLPPVTLIGVHAAHDPFASHDDDLRAQEYLPSRGTPRFAAHAHFFVHEVRAWVERHVGIIHHRSTCGVFGFSNGGVFAATTGLNYPQYYGQVIACSMGIAPRFPPMLVRPRARFYCLAGTLEEGFYATTKQFAYNVQRRGFTTIFRERVCGHDYLMWQEELPAAMQWAFPTSNRPSFSDREGRQ